MYKWLRKVVEVTVIIGVAIWYKLPRKATSRGGRKKYTEKYTGKRNI